MKSLFVLAFVLFINLAPTAAALAADQAAPAQPAAPAVVKPYSSYDAQNWQKHSLLVRKVIMLNDGGLLDVIINGHPYDGITPIDILVATTIYTVLHFTVKALRSKKENDEDEDVAVLAYNPYKHSDTPILNAHDVVDTHHKV